MFKLTSLFSSESLAQPSEKLTFNNVQNTIYITWITSNVFNPLSSHHTIKIQFNKKESKWKKKIKMEINLNQSGQNINSFNFWSAQELEQMSLTCSATGHIPKHQQNKDRKETIRSTFGMLNKYWKLKRFREHGLLNMCVPINWCVYIRQTNTNIDWINRKYTFQSSFCS